MEDSLGQQTIQVQAAGIGKVPVDGHVLRQHSPRILLVQDRLVTITSQGTIVATLDLLKIFGTTGQLVKSIEEAINPSNKTIDGR